MRGIAKGWIMSAAVAVVLASVEARADGYVNPWVGVNITSRTDEGRRALGVTTGYMGGGVFGFEGDFGYSPNFFGWIDDAGKTTVFTTMGNFILGVPIGGVHGAGVRPFVSGGLGLMWTVNDRGSVVSASRSSNDFCYELGAGMMGFFNQHVGLRGDLRYLRTLEDADRLTGFDLEAGRLRYWRVSAGITFR